MVIVVYKTRFRPRVHPMEHAKPHTPDSTIDSALGAIVLDIASVKRLGPLQARPKGQEGPQDKFDRQLCQTRWMLAFH